MQTMACKMTFLGLHWTECWGHIIFRKWKWNWRIVGWTIWLNKKYRRECACSENYNFPFHSGILSITFRFKRILNVCYFNLYVLNELIEINTLSNSFGKPSFKNWIHLKFEGVLYLK
jgi:hypothetical protein